MNYNAFTTAELASLVGWRMSNVHKRLTERGHHYHCKLNGVLMRVSEARAKCIGQYEAAQKQLTEAKAGGSQ